MGLKSLSLRITLGILGMLLPIIVLSLALIYGYGFPDSISATYYLAPCITPFMIILGASAIVLMNYKGYDLQDNIICSIAGIFALFICLFPCNLDGQIDPETLVGTFQLPAIISGWIHNISAASFFILLAYNSFFLFTKGDNNPTPNKKKRNIIYRVCGIGMIASLICILPIAIFDIWGGTWLIELFALIFFGISWLTKADVFPFLFCDTAYTD